jgi:hypothetical protein
LAEPLQCGELRHPSRNKTQRFELFGSSKTHVPLIHALMLIERPRLAGAFRRNPGFNATHVQSHFAEQRLGYHDVYAVNAGAVHARDTLQFAAEIEAQGISWLLASLPWASPWMFGPSGCQ